MKHFNLKNIAETNLILLLFTIALHWLSFFDAELFNPPFTRDVLYNLGFRREPLFYFGMGGVFVFMLFFIYVPAIIFDITTAKLSTKFNMDTLISLNDMRFKKGKYTENLIRLVIFSLVCLTPYLLIESIADTWLILPFTSFHMILMAITTFTHGIQTLVLYRILRSKFGVLTRQPLCKL